jgi:structural maintenance of chromosome 2
MLSAFDEEADQMECAAKNKTSDITEAKLEIQKLGHDVERFYKQRKKLSRN